MLSCSVVSDSLWSHGLSSAKFLYPGNFPGKNTGAGGHFLLHGIFLTQGSNPCLLQILIVRRMLYHCTTWEALLLSRNSQMPDSLIIIIYHWSFSDFQIKVWYLCSLLQKCLLFSCGGKFKSSKKEIYDWFCMLYYGRWFHYGKHCFPKPCQHRCQMVSSTPSAVDPYHLGFWNTNSMPPTLIPFTWSRTKEAGMLTKFSLAFDFVLHDIRCCK